MILCMGRTHNITISSLPFTERGRGAEGRREGDMISGSTYNLIIAAINLIYRHTHTQCNQVSFLLHLWHKIRLSDFAFGVYTHTLQDNSFFYCFTNLNYTYKMHNTHIHVHTSAPGEQKQIKFDGLID